VYVSQLIGKKIAYFLRPILMSAVACLVVSQYITLSNKIHDFWQIRKLRKCVFLYFLQLPREIFLILSRSERDTIIDINRYSCKVLVILVIF
jgi:hypothetical protein